MKRTLLCGCLIVSLTSCRNGGSKTADPAPRNDPARAEVRERDLPERTDLRKRATQYWEARAAKNWDVLYSFLEPWQRESGSVEEYKKWAEENEPFSVQSFKIVDIEQEGPYGWVRVSYDSTLRVYPDSPARTSEVHQKWQAEGGDWLPVTPQQVEAYPLPPSRRDRKAEDDLRRRFDQAWAARRAQDWSSLYELTDPRDRDDVALNEFSESEGLFDYLSHRIRWVEVVGQQGKIRVVYHHKVTDPNMTKLPPRDAELTENWVKINDEWYRDLKPGN